MPPTTSIKAQEGRFARLEAIEWWYRSYWGEATFL